MIRKIRLHNTLNLDFKKKQNNSIEIKNKTSQYIGRLCFTLCVILLILYLYINVFFNKNFMSIEPKFSLIIEQITY